MKTMKFAGMLLMALVCGSQLAFAQQKQGRDYGRKPMGHEQMSEMKAKRIAGDLALDDKTAEKFKTTYMEYMKEMHQLWQKDFPMNDGKGKDGEKMRKNKDLSDAEVEKMIEDRFDRSRKMLDIREKYYKEFKKFLTPKQIQKMYDKEMGDAGRFHNEQNRRAGMKRSGGNRHQPMQPR